MSRDQPQFPIYIPSKSRHDSRLTMKALDLMAVPYFVVIESQQFADYAAVIDPARLLVLDPAYQRDYDACMELAPDQSRGSGPARNFAWDHALAAGFSHYWCVDDNIKAFWRLNQNLKVKSSTGAIFRAMEDFAGRYKNVAMSGPNYTFFAKRKQKIGPFIPNTRIYSCNLIRTDLPMRWRARYNEDVDLSLRMLKAGWCTILFNAFLQEKTQTLTMKGGNTDEVYAGGTLAKSQMIADLHPDVARVVWKFKRPHHHVDYGPFKRTKLIRRDDVEIPQSPDEYGMRLMQVQGRRPHDRRDSASR